MKILAFVHAYVPFHNAGSETMLHHILRARVAAGDEVTVLISEHEDKASTTEYDIEGVHVIPHVATDRQHFNRIVNDFDVVFTHLETSERVSIVCRKAKIPSVQVIHNTMWQTEGYLAEGCDLAIYNSVWVADWHARAYKGPLAGIPSRNREVEGETVIEIRYRVQSAWPSVVVHPAVYPQEYKATGPHDCITLINLCPNKGPEVFYEMARRFPRTQFLGVLGGYGKQQLTELPNVEFVENTYDVRENIYARTKVLLVPSEYESFGRVAIEAAASGIPTVANPTPGLTEALGPEGIYCEREDLDSWEEALIQLEKPTRYAVAKRNALKRSKYWAESIESDLAALDLALKQL